MVKRINEEGSIFLDFFRGVSAQLVLIGHLLSFYGLQQLYNIPHIQDFGVLVFFVLSGFLITKITLVKGIDYGFKNFITDRFSRIYYSFIPAILFVLGVDLIWKFVFYNYDYNDHFNFQSFFSNLFMLQSCPLINAEPFGSARTFWTVSIEWWFYVFFGILYYRKKISKPVIFLFFTISFLFVVFNVSRRSDLSIYWAIGLLFAVLDNSVSLKIKPPLYIVAFWGSFFLLLLRMAFLPDLFDVGIALFFGLMLYLVQNVPIQLNKYVLNKNFSAFSKFLASFSYSLYLIHYTIIAFTMNFIKDILVWQQMLLLFVLSNGVAYLFFIFFEKNNYKFRNLLKSKSKNIAI
jgi:peptidoglycan/LPS O-acetylase OafA/YrhL